MLEEEAGKNQEALDWFSQVCYPQTFEQYVFGIEMELSREHMLPLAYNEDTQVFESERLYGNIILFVPLHTFYQAVQYYQERFGSLFPAIRKAMKLESWDIEGYRANGTVWYFV